MCAAVVYVYMYLYEHTYMYICVSADAYISEPAYTPAVRTRVFGEIDLFPCSS